MASRLVKTAPTASAQYSRFRENRSRKSSETQVRHHRPAR